MRHWTMKHHHQLFRCFWRTLVTLLLCEGTPLMMFRGSLTLTLNRDHSSFTLQQDARITHSPHNGMEFSALNIVLKKFVESKIASKQLIIIHLQLFVIHKLRSVFFCLYNRECVITISPVIYITITVSYENPYFKW